jgi:hypothetical protein
MVGGKKVKLVDYWKAHSNNFQGAALDADSYQCYT